MYKLQLIQKYLFKRRIAWVALVAVMLCTAMVLIVVSVMSGWLKSFKSSFHGMTGDVVIAADSPLGGFPFYQEMIDGIRKLPDVQAAVPIIHTGAMLNVDREVRLVELYGYPPDIGDVNDWPSGLHLNIDDRKQALTKAAEKSGIDDERRLWLKAQINAMPFGLHPNINYADAVASPRARAAAWNRAGMIVSSGLAGIRASEPLRAEFIRSGLYTAPVSLTVIPVHGDQAIDPSSISADGFWIVDDNKSRVWQLDFTNVYISFEKAQQELGMAGSKDEEARCSEVEIKARPGVDLDTLKSEVERITDDVRGSHYVPHYYGFTVKTWLEQQGAVIKAVENEVVITTALFGVISMVAVLLIFCIFYMIVVEKTKDIGIIKSAGATGAGILSLFLGYGVSIGVIGAGLGFTFAYYFLRNINELHAWLGRQMHIQLWSAETYQFDRIPSEMEPRTVTYVLLVAVLSATLGALLPALRAAGMNPVDALKYE